MRESIKKLLLGLKEFQTARVRINDRRFEIKRVS